MKNIISSEIRDFLTNFVREDPIVFLHLFKGLDNITDPKAVVRQLQPIVNIPERDMKKIEKTES